ncbi:MAG TPA: hypothetical protein VKE50_04760 [Thermoanaerobaculia bacterium]|nr:hypothetical protein [Thermoanaerobaculia bacterium]
MTNALVFIEACSVCGLVQRVYLARGGRRKTPLACPSCQAQAGRPDRVRGSREESTSSRRAAVPAKSSGSRRS